jgi:acetyl-CoA synthetase/medium-chain acyl-CoA synthetase
VATPSESPAPAGFNFTRDVVDRLAASGGGRALTYIERDGVIQRLTFEELAADAARWAHLLRGRGLDVGDRVLVAVGAPTQWAPIVLGAVKAGLVAVPCPATVEPLDLAERAARTGASLLVTDDRALHAAEALRGLVEREPDVLRLEEAPALLARCRPVAPTEERRATDPALVLHTAGTSGAPHGTVHSHAYMSALRAQAAHWLDVRAGDVVWSSAPAGTAASIWVTLVGPWSAGAQVVVHEGCDSPAELVDQVEQLGVTILAQAPADYRQMLEAAGLRRGGLRHATSTGDPLAPQVTAAFREATGLTIADGYGQTENAVLIAGTRGDPGPDGALGRPTPGHDVAVVDEAGTVAPAGTEGDIALRGRPATLFLGYVGAPDAAAAAARGEWYVTGDRGVQDEDGVFWFAGRAGDAIVTGGRRVRAFEVESLLLRHPAVASVAVVARPDSRLGQVARAVVTTRPAGDPVDDLGAELAALAAAEGMPIPLETEVVDALPTGPTGKVDRAALRRAARERADVVRLVEPPPEQPAMPPLRLVPPPGDADPGRGRFDAELTETASEAQPAKRRWRRRGDERQAQRAAQAAARAEAERRKQAEAEARREEDERRRTEAAERRARDEAERRAEQEAEQARKEAERAEEQRLLAEAKERTRAEAEQRRVQEEARKAELERQRAEAAAERKQQEAEAKQAEARRRAEEKAAAELRDAEAEERRRQEAEERRAQEEEARAAAARRAEQAALARREADAEAAERRRQEELDRKADEARRQMEQAEASRLAQARRLADEEARRDAEARRQAEREADEIRRGKRPAPVARASVPPVTPPPTAPPPVREAPAEDRARVDEERRRAAEARRARAAVRKPAPSSPRPPADAGEEDEREVDALLERISSYGIHADQPARPDD